MMQCREQPASLWVHEKSAHWALTGLLDGMTLRQAIKKKTLYYQDYHTVLADAIVPQVSHPLSHLAGRSCLAKHTEACGKSVSYYIRKANRCAKDTQGSTCVRTEFPGRCRLRG